MQPPHRNSLGLNCLLTMLSIKEVCKVYPFTQMTTKSWEYNGQMFVDCQLLFGLASVLAILRAQGRHWNGSCIRGAKIRVITNTNKLFLICSSMPPRTLHSGKKFLVGKLHSHSNMTIP